MCGTHHLNGLRRLGRGELLKEVHVCGRSDVLSAVAGHAAAAGTREHMRRDRTHGEEGSAVDNLRARTAVIVVRCADRMLVMMSVLCRFAFAADKVIATVAAEREKVKMAKAHRDTLKRQQTTQLMWEEELQRELEYQRKMGLR